MIKIISFDISENEISVIQEYVDTKEKNKQTMYEDVLKKLSEKYNIDLTKKEVLNYINSEILTKIGIAKVLYKKGRAKTVTEAITKYVDECMPYEIIKDEFYLDKKFLEHLNKKIYLNVYDTNAKNTENIDLSEFNIINNKTFSSHMV